MYHQKMSYGGVLLFSVFLITIVSSINIVDAGRSPAAKKKTAAELLLDSDQHLGIEVTKREYMAGLGGRPLAASSLKPPVSPALHAAMEAARKAAEAEEVKEAAAAIEKLLETTNIFLKQIPDDATLNKLLGLYDPTGGPIIPKLLTKRTDAANALSSLVQGLAAIARIKG